MPPFSRGLLSSFQISLHFHRQLSSAPRFTQSFRAGTRPPKRAPVQKPVYKSSPIEGKAHPAGRRPQLLSRKPGASGNPAEDAEEVVRNQTLWSRVKNKVPYRIRKSIANILIFGPIVAIVCIHFPVQIMNTAGGSMSPFLNPGHQGGRGEEPERMDKVLVYRIQFPYFISLFGRGQARKGDFGRGDIVVFKSPMQQGHDGGTRVAVKRIVGVAGDRVEPLPGWVGEQDGVVVPFNHLWVEGDVEDRSRSVDSNWYGPISKNLVVGRVEWLLEPWWRPTRMVIAEQSWPAKEKARVQEAVVQDAMINPDEAESRERWLDGTANKELESWQADRARLVEMAKGGDSRWDLQVFRLRAKKEAAREDPRTLGVATALVDEVDRAFNEASIEWVSQEMIDQEKSSIHVAKASRTVSQPSKESQQDQSRDVWGIPAEQTKALAEGTK